MAIHRLSCAALLMVMAVSPRSTAGAQPQPDTVEALPTPTGGYRVGTAVAYLVDSTRAGAPFPRGRPIVLQLWYPATGATTAAAPYLIEPGLMRVLLAGPYYAQDSATLRSWGSEATHSALDAAVAPGRHPLIAFSVGLGVIRANYTSIAEELASFGFVIALVESPLQGLFVLRDGTIVTDSTDQLAAPANHRAAVREWTRDISVVLDRLTAARIPGSIVAVAHSIDWSRVGATGHSTGGLVAVSLCQSDVRVKACIDLDGGFVSPEGEPIVDFVVSGTIKPTLVLQSEPDYTDADFARRGLTRAAWEKRGDAGRVALDALIARAHGPIWVAHVRGTGHFSFSDAPFVMPSTITRFGGRLLSWQRTWQVITGTMRAFFAQELDGQRDAFGHFAAATPALVLESSRR